MSRRLERVLPLAAALVAALVFSLHASGGLARLEHIAAEARARLLARKVESDIVIVEIDPKSIEELQGWPWPRTHYARLLQHLERAGPQSVLLDIDLSSPSSTPRQDELLESILARWTGPPVMLPVHFPPSSTEVPATAVTRPLDRFVPHVHEVAVVLEPDADGLVRAARSAWRVGGSILPSVFDASSRLPPMTRMAIDFSILPSSFGSASFSDVLNGEIDPDAFRGKKVYVGATAVELRDAVPVPVHRVLPGVVVQALAAATLAEGAPRAPPPWLYFALLTGWTLGAARLLARPSWRRNALVLAGGLVLLAGGSIYVYAAHRISMPIVPLTVTAVLMFVIGALRSLDEQTWRAITYALRVRRRDALLRSIVESTTDAIISVETDGRIRTSNAAAAVLFGCPADELAGASLLRFVPSLESALAGDASPARPAVEHVARCNDGRQIPVDVSVSRIDFDDADLFTVILRDISERKAHERELEHRATHDALTGLPNREALYRRLDAELASSAKLPRMALLLLDLGRFGEVNDTLGHDVGDALLAEAGSRIGGVVGERGFVARIGADEFTVLLAPVSSRREIDECAETLLAALRRPFHVRGIGIDLGATIGIALFPEHAQDAKELLRRADVAMYGAKRRGSAYEHYDHNHDRHTVRRLGMISELRTALTEGSLELHYQPQVNLRTDLAVGVEALLRWRHPIFGSVPPEEFIGLAESSDLIRPLTEWTLTRALNDVADWKRRGVELRVAVNLSARMLQNPTLPQQVERLLATHAVDVRQLELEITESAMMLDPDHARRIVKALHTLGIAVSIDDYGTGFSSLGYLRDLDVSALKLDKSFVLDLETRSEDRVIAESTMQLAHALNLVIVAEGIETESVKSYLTRLGYDLGQGYGLSRPLPAEECLRWVIAYNAASRKRAG